MYIGIYGDIFFQNLKPNKKSYVQFFNETPIFSKILVCTNLAQYLKVLDAFP